ncbi:MAG: DUF4156 domain-containing protein [Limnohabitans sp.]
MKHLSMLMSAAILAGCAATPVAPGAERVRLTQTEPGKACKFLGDATGNQGNFFQGSWTSNENLETGARHDLKNKAAAMGGNLVVLLTQRAGQTGSFSMGNGMNMSGAGSTQQTNVTLSGNVYHCPE